MTRKTQWKTNVGGVSVLIILTVLSLTVFATLSASSANYEMKMTDKTKISVESYYKADKEAQYRLQEIDTILVDSKDKSTKELEKNLESLEGVLTDIDNNLITTEYEIPINQKQNLYVRLKIKPQEVSKERYTIADWKVIRTEEIVYEEEELDVWDGSLIE